MAKQKPKYMVDMRCPRCNSPLDGDRERHEVRYYVRLPKHVKQCARCHTRVHLVEDTDTDDALNRNLADVGIRQFYFDVTKQTFYSLKK